MTDQRQRWRDFICSPEHPGRHLASLGSAVAASTGEPIDIADLEAFLGKLEGGDDDVDHLASIVDLVSGGYGRFMGTDLPRLLDLLAVEARYEDAVVGPALVGNPRWDRTAIGRISGRLRPGQYVSRTARRSHELPENLLLRWLVADLAQAVTFIRRRAKGNRLHDTLETIGVRAGDARANHLFASITEPVRLDLTMLSAARSRRRPEYTMAADLAARRSLLNAGPDEARWHALLMLLAVGWLEPVDIDDLFELYSLVMVIDVISQELGFGDPDEFGLVLPGRKQVASFDRDCGTLKVFFDQSPSAAIGVRGRYRDVVRSHRGVTGSERRPDIILTLEREGEPRRTLLVEMKKSRDGTYISESIYKVFGYLYDFADCWPVPSEKPKALLLIPEGVEQVAPSPGVVVATADDRHAIARALSAAFLD